MTEHRAQTEAEAARIAAFWKDRADRLEREHSVNPDTESEDAS